METNRERPHPGSAADIIATRPELKEHLEAALSDEGISLRDLDPLYVEEMIEHSAMVFGILGGYTVNDIARNLDVSYITKDVVAAIKYRQQDANSRHR